MSKKMKQKIIRRIGKMEEAEAAAMLAKHDKLLHQLAHRCALRCGRPEEECYGQALYGFMETCKTYDPKKGTFITYLHKVVWTNLIHWGRANPLVRDHETILETLHAPEPPPYRRIEMSEWMASLTEEVRTVFRIVLDGPAEIMGMMEQELMTPKAVMGALRRHLRREGWTLARIFQTFRECKAAVKEL